MKVDLVSFFMLASMASPSFAKLEVRISSTCFDHVKDAVLTLTTRWKKECKGKQEDDASKAEWSKDG
jgi:hypothetical protein